MKFTIPASTVPQPLNALRKAGYTAFTDPNTGHESFTLRTGPDFYPRFHLYVSQKEEQTTFDLHLDQKQPSYGGNTHMHSGEYDGPIIENELKRVYRWILAAKSDLG
jgi:hypothetical protein